MDCDLNGLQNKEEDEVTIDLKDMFFVILGRLPVIILAGAIAAAAVFTGARVIVKPQYVSEAKIYIHTHANGINDYLEIAESHSVLAYAMETARPDMTLEELRDSINLTVSEGSHIMTISVKNKDPKMACALAQALKESAMARIREVKDANCKVVEDANLPSEPLPVNVFKKTVMGGVFGTLLAFLAVGFMYVFDDTIKTADDVEKYLALNVLTTVPIYKKGEIKTAQRKTAGKIRKNI